MREEAGNPETVPLSRIISALESGVSVNGEDRPASDGEPGVLKVSAVSGGQFIPGENKAIVADERPKVALSPSPRKGDILISRSNTLDLVGACGYVERDHPNLYLPDKLWRVLFRDPQRDHPRWLLHVLDSPAIRAALKAKATGTSGSMKNISKRTFLNIRVQRPSCEEQAHIARVLDCWVKEIELVTKALSAKSAVKKKLSYQLLTGALRFPDFGGRVWSERAFGAFLSESRIPGGNGARAKKLTVRLFAQGVIAKRDTRPGSVSTQHYRRRAGQFIYSKLDFMNGAFGIIPESLDGYEPTLDLPAFDTDESLDPRWLLYFVSREGFYRNQVGLANGGRRARRVNADDLLKLRIKVPEKPEQIRIADTLQALDREIDLLRQQLAALKQQKKGLMQKLLTGEVRVRV